MDLCQACRKLLYRTDACKGDGSFACGRQDGGSKRPVITSQSYQSTAVDARIIEKLAQSKGERWTLREAGGSPAIKQSSGGSSAVERKASNLGVEGSTPSRRSNTPVRVARQRTDKPTREAKLDAEERVQLPPPGPSKPKRGPGRPPLAEPTSKRAAYQREYMRRKRQEQKAKP